MSANGQIRRTPAEDGLLQRFAERSGDGFAELRQAAMAAFEKTGLPHRRVEAYKYTDLKRLMAKAVPIAAPATKAEIAAAGNAGTALGGLDRYRLTLVNGAFVPALSDVVGLPAGVSVTTLLEALRGDASAFAAAADGLDDATVNLNSAFMQDGVAIRIAKGVKLNKPIEIAHLFVGAEAGAATLRHAIAVEDGGAAEIVESFSGTDVAYQVNSLTALVVGAGAELGLTRLQSEGPAALHLGTINGRLAMDARLRLFSLMAGAEVARTQVFLTLEGEGGSADIRGATLGRGRQHADTALQVDHKVAGSESREIFKSVLDDEARGIFQGKIVVHPGAQGTDARMMTKALLLSETAEFDTKPELEIYADDVKCSHG
ncbi:MAG: SufD family Fe-S cluster assembly protein, partial [Hyphomicrobiales bacterium]|nr:SufD family Fe-S cluster assembly protein [Hyphomicrobiales bacterium]